MPDQEDAYTEAVKNRMGGAFFRKRASSGATDEEREAIAQMRHNRAVNARVAGAAGAGRGGSQLSFATGRPRDPMFYWRQNNVPYDITKKDELVKIREFCRLLYLTHPIVASCIDIFSKYPLIGMELNCKDDQLTDFYSTLFFDQLNYKEYLIDVGREYWTVGEAWPFGSFNEALGVWEDDELLNPDDVEVRRSPFMKDPNFLIRLPETLRDLITKQSPRWEYEKLMAAYPELQHYVGENALMPVSNILLQQLPFKGDTFSRRGVPILMRGMRGLIQEEMLNAAMDSVADRLYTPLILVKLGASAQDLGTTQPWIPTEDDLADFEEALDGALSADFRVLTHHFGVSMEPVFGRENMPNMDGDFERLTERILQVFGMSKTMLSGAGQGETYAADAMNRDLISQLLTTYQARLIDLYRQRALVVAEAQEHYDYDERNGKRYVKMEEIYEIDEETGEGRVVEQPKLLIPDLHMKTMNMSDEQQEAQFLEALRASGVPISMKSRMVNIPIDLDDEIERTRDEQVALAVAEQETRKEIYKTLKSKGLPIPDELRTDFEPRAANMPDEQVDPATGLMGPSGMGGAPGMGMVPGQPMDPSMDPGMDPTQQALPPVAAVAGIDPNTDLPARVPMLGIDPPYPGGTPTLAPTQQDLAGDPPDGDSTINSAETAAQQAQQMMLMQPQQPPPSVPEESHEMRDGMPTQAMFRQASRMREIVDEHYVPVAEVQDEDEAPEDRRPKGKFGTPKHVGMRRHASVDKTTPMDEWGTDQG